MAQNFMREAIDALVKRGVAVSGDFSEDGANDEDFMQFEEDFQIRLPDSLRAYLQCRCFEFEMVRAAIPEDQEYDEDSFRDGVYCEPVWMDILSVPKHGPLGDLRSRMGFLRELADDPLIAGVTSEDVRNMIPVGDYMAGAGMMVMDLSFPESNVNIKDPETWNIRWFDHEDFDWEESYMEQGRLVGQAAFPSLQFLIECYFGGKYDKLYEEQLQEDGKGTVDYGHLIRR